MAPGGILRFSAFQIFAHELPGSLVNVGAVKKNMTGVIAGLPLRTKIVFTYSIANFPIMRCLE